MALSASEIGAIKLELHNDTSIFDPRGGGQWYDRNANPIPGPLIIAGGFCEFKWVAGSGPVLFHWEPITKCSSNPATPCHVPISGTPMPIGTLIRVPC